MTNVRKAMYFLGVLDDRDMEWLATHGTKRFVPAGTVLIREGEPIQSVLILLEGRLSVTIKAGFTLATLKDGEIVGEISFIDSRPPLATVSAAENSHVLDVPRDRLRRRLEAEPPFAARFYRAAALYLADRLRVTSSRLGYGAATQDNDATELDEAFLDNVSMGATRFDALLRMLSIPTTGVAG